MISRENSHTPLKIQGNLPQESSSDAKNPFNTCRRHPAGAPDHSFARSKYDPSSVMITTLVPTPTCGGTMVLTPFESTAGL